MLSLWRAPSTRRLAGSPVSLPYPHLDKLVNLRTKELLIIAGAPGAGKSALAICLALGMSEPVLYVAQDSPASVSSRMIAHTLNRPVRTVQRDLMSNPSAVASSMRRMVAPEKVTITMGPKSVKDIEHEILALREWLGRTPPVVIIDNLIDMKSEKGISSDLGFYSDVLLNLKQLAIEHDLVMIVLHHVVRGDFNHDGSMGRSPLRLRDLLYAGEREARHAWGVYTDGDGGLYLQILKQQDGPADPFGKLRIRMQFDPSTNRISEAKLEREEE